MDNSYVQSRFDRRPDDGYATLDPRCLIALTSAWDVPMPALDPCTRTTGTGLAGVMPGSITDVRLPHIRSVVTNPPYGRPAVDDITQHLIRAVTTRRLELAAILVRIQWDCAKSRSAYWEPPFAASIRLQFRPWWHEERLKQPIHSYQWLIWDRRHRVQPLVIHAGADL